MHIQRFTVIVVVMILLILEMTSATPGNLEPIPDKLIVLTFDDRSRTWITFVAPLLKEYGFGATFFVTEFERFGYYGNEKFWITWEEIRRLHEMGFEIGNHTRTHPNITKLSREKIIAELEQIEQACREHGIPKPTTFCYPGYNHARNAVDVLMEKGFLFARRGVEPEFERSDRGDLGPAYDPAEDHPLLIPTTWSSGPNWTSVEDIVWGVEQARDGKIAVLTFHGVPDYYSHCSTEPALFEKYMKYLHDEGCTVIALRDLAKYVDPGRRP